VGIVQLIPCNTLLAPKDLWIFLNVIMAEFLS
jgi:hypothetical protein